MSDRSPDDEFADELIELTRSISRAYFALKDFGDHIGVFHEYGSNVTEILNLLYLHGPHSITEIARFRRISRQFVVKLARQFEARGMVTLEPNAADKRGYIVKLTSEGVAQWEARRLIFRNGLYDRDHRLKLEELRSMRAAINTFADDLEANMHVRGQHARARVDDFAGSS